jgi:hypothetical protein
MKTKLFVVSVSIVLLVVGGAIASSAATQNKGAEIIELSGGNRGHVPFPHHKHQEKLGDCKICHSIFPQSSGAIEKLKSEGKIKQKYVMNKLCTKCHREKKKAGLKAGPTTCSKCHIK